MGLGVQENNYILGSGITSLILKNIDLINKNFYKIIGNNIGGQFNSNFQLGPRILQKNSIVDKFLSNFNKNLNSKIFKVGYYYDNDFHDICLLELRKEYAIKTRGKFDSNKNSWMNNGNNNVIGYDLSNINFLIKNLYNHFIISAISKIDLNEQNIFIENEIIHYDKIINTIPIDIFAKLCNLECNIKYEKVYFYKVKKSTVNFYNNKYDFIYFPTDEYSFHRITSIDENYICIEVKEKNNKNINFYYEDVYILNNGILIEDNFDYSFFNDKNIKFAGRYAEAKHEVRMHNIIEKAEGILYE